MKPTEILSSEHRVIEGVLDCLEAMVGQAKAAGRLEPQPAKDAVAFFRDFADRCHHGKEEAHLFPALERTQAEMQPWGQEMHGCLLELDQLAIHPNVFRFHSHKTLLLDNERGLAMAGVPPLRPPSLIRLTDGR